VSWLSRVHQSFRCVSRFRTKMEVQYLHQTQWSTATYGFVIENLLLITFSICLTGRIFL
jgi:hypothetical protein